jgi:hypothetical protein
MAPTGFSQQAKKVKVVAYINVTSGCQTETVALIESLAKTYAGKATVEIVDFGGDGKQRWLDDGMKCMAITIDGTAEVPVVMGGVEVSVPFKMPVGFMWRHEELEAALRQAVEGVSDADRERPSIETAKAGDVHELRIGGEAVVTLADGERIRSAAEALRGLAKDKPLEADEFGIAGKPEDLKATLMARDTAVLELRGTDFAAKGNTLTPEEFRDGVMEHVVAVVGAFPRVRRPFPGAAAPGGRRQ